MVGKIQVAHNVCVLQVQLMFPCADGGFPDIEFFHQGIGEEFLQLFLRLPCVVEAL